MGGLGADEKAVFIGSFDTVVTQVREGLGRQETDTSRSKDARA